MSRGHVTSPFTFVGVECIKNSFFVAEGGGGGRHHRLCCTTASVISSQPQKRQRQQQQQQRHSLLLLLLRRRHHSRSRHTKRYPPKLHTRAAPGFSSQHTNIQPQSNSINSGIRARPSFCCPPLLYRSIPIFVAGTVNVFPATCFSSPSPA